MATAKKTTQKEFNYVWEGKDRSGKVVRGEMRAVGEAMVQATLRRQGFIVTKVKKQSARGGGKVEDKDIVLFTRQLATMMKAGVPLLQSFDIVAKGSSNAAVTKLLTDIKTEIETGATLNAAFRKHPLLFDQLYCNLIQAGEQAGILESLLDRLATYKEKSLALKKKIKGAMGYPIAVLSVAAIVTAIIMIFVVPQFKQVFSSFGANLPGPTLILIAISEYFVSYWWLMAGSIGGGLYTFFYFWKRSLTMQIFMDRLVLKLPIFGDLLRKAVIARWTRTLATMFAAGVPLVESLDSVAGASGNYVYKMATKQIQSEISTGNTLVAAMQNANVFPSMVLQMVAIGEESGALDSMLSKVADFFEDEVDEAVENITALMEPMIMAVLGVVIGGMVIALYLPIFKLGSVVG
ncbi:MAG: type II secretion system F family protein [Verrucomicrobia bacterium]|nr:MAG: type II secretion system F family protein [Verrucomicrobiota bacterium]